MTTWTTHHACPVDATPCWKDRECPHVKDGVRACEVERVYGRPLDDVIHMVMKTQERKG